MTYTWQSSRTRSADRSRGGAFDLERVWIDAAVSDATIREILASAAKVLDDPDLGAAAQSQNVTEWAKKEACWIWCATCRTTCQQNSRRSSPIKVHVTENARSEAANTQKIDTGIAAQTKVVTMQASEWVAVEEFARERQAGHPKGH